MSTGIGRGLKNPVYYLPDEYFLNHLLMQEHQKFINSFGGVQITYDVYLEARRVHQLPRYRVREMLGLDKL